MEKELVVYSTEASEYFAKRIASQLGVPLGQVERKSFGDGERYLRLGVSRRGELLGKTAIIVGSTHKDEDFLEILRVGGRLSQETDRRIFVIPFFGYSTMEREVEAGEVVAAKENIRLLNPEHRPWKHLPPDGPACVRPGPLF